MFNQNAFNSFVIRNKVIGFFDSPITLKSGKQSHMYINWRTITNDVALLEACALFIIEFCKKNNIQPTCFYGVPEGATKLGLLTQYLWAKQQSAKPGSHILSMGRAKPKPHGSPQDKYFVGEPAGDIILLEDVTTTGQSMIDVLDQLQNLGKNIIGCIGLTTRETIENRPTVNQQLKERNVPYYALSNAKTLLELLNKKIDSGINQDLLNKELNQLL